MANSRSRRRNIVLFILLAALLSAAFALHHWRYGQWRVETANAQVNGNLVRVAALTDGTVASLYVEQGEFVEAGATLLALADDDARALYQQAVASLAMASQQIAALAARAAAQRADIERHRALLTNIEREHQRHLSLAADGLIADEQLTASSSQLQQQRAALLSAEQQLVEIERRLGPSPQAEHPTLQQASAALRLAAYRLNKHQVRAPISGYIAKRTVNLGQLIEAGAPLLTLVDPSDRWVEANFKEDQLRHLRIGQPVQIYSELYGRQQLFHGVVAGPALATGAQFALLPAQNATGNWVKILQRVPVRIEFIEPLESATPLPIGASLEVVVDTHSRAGERLQSIAAQRQSKHTAPQQSRYGGDVDSVINATIEQYLGL